MGFVQACDWQKGELIVYRTASGTDVHLRVFDLQRDASGTSPVCELVDLAPGTKLDQATVAAAPARHFKSDPLVNPPSLRATRLGGASRSLILLGAQGPDDIPTARLNRTGIVTNPWHEPGRSVNVAGVQIAAAPFRVLRWRDLDASLKDLYGIE
jgi:hypothetical protein